MVSVADDGRWRRDRGTQLRMSDQDIPEPDALEQALAVDEPPVPLTPSADAEAPEADALEQAQLEPLDDDRARG